MTDYQPVSCEYHSYLEHLIILARPVLLTWINKHQKQFSETVQILDIYSRKREEFIRVQIQAETPFEIRLDRIMTKFV